MNRSGPASTLRLRLTPTDRKKLRRTCRRYGAPYRDVLRAKIILQLNDDPCVAEAARLLGVSETTIRKWRHRFMNCGRLKGLSDEPRPGRPLEIDAVTRCGIVAMACGEPSDFGVEYRSIWSMDSLHARFHEMHAKVQLSRSSVVRILNERDIRPHRVKMWLHSPDPNFRKKVTNICRLYLKPPQGEIVLCMDEKTGMQALGRKHPVRGPAPQLAAWAR